MNEVSIIINGVRYDTHVENLDDECSVCDLRDICDSKSFYVNEACIELLGNGYNFKKSTKSFEE